jgi:hypothetical protein
MSQEAVLLALGWHWWCWCEREREEGGCFFMGRNHEYYIQRRTNKIGQRGNVAGRQGSNSELLLRCPTWE